MRSFWSFGSTDVLCNFPLHRLIAPNIMRPPKAATNDVAVSTDGPTTDTAIFHTPQQPIRRHHHHHNHHDHRSATMLPVSSNLSAGSYVNNGNSASTTPVVAGATACSSSGSAMKLSVSMISLTPLNSGGPSIGSVATMRPYNSLKVSE